MSGPVDQQEQEAGARLVVLLQGLCRALTFYDANNDAVKHQVDALRETLASSREAGHEHVELKLLAEEFFVNGRLLKVDAKLYERATELAALLGSFDVGEIRVPTALDTAQLEGFVADLSTSLRTKQHAFAPDGYGGLTLGRAQGRSVAAYRFEPDRLAIWLFSSLLDLTATLFELVDAGETPSLLPLKRSLQLAIDNMRDHGAIYQVLTQVRGLDGEVSRATRRTSVALDLVGFGQFVGLDPSDLLVLALAGVLGGLSESSEPDEAVKLLFGFPGLGELAMPVTLALHDARTVRAGGKGGVPGRIVAVVEAYEELLAEGAGPHEALVRLASGKVPGAEPAVARVFGGWKGPWPLGSVVKLEDGRHALVLGQGEDAESKKTPRVAVLTEGRLGERLDLAGGPRVVATVRAREIGFDPTKR